MPYRTFDDRIDGLVITFFNISDHKQLEVELNETRQMHSLLLNRSADVVIKLSTNWEIVEYNTGAEKFFGRKRKEVLDQNYFQLFVPESNQKKAEKELSKLMKSREDTNYTMPVLTANGEQIKVEWSVNTLINSLDIPTGIIIIAKNTTKS